MVRLAKAHPNKLLLKVSVKFPGPSHASLSKLVSNSLGLPIHHYQNSRYCDHIQDILHDQTTFSFYSWSGKWSGELPIYVVIVIIVIVGRQTS